MCRRKFSTNTRSPGFLLVWLTGEGPFRTENNITWSEWEAIGDDPGAIGSAPKVARGCAEAVWGGLEAIGAVRGCPEAILSVPEAILRRPAGVRRLSERSEGSPSQSGGCLGRSAGVQRRSGADIEFRISQLSKHMLSFHKWSALKVAGVARGGCRDWLPHFNCSCRQGGTIAGQLGLHSLI